MSTLLVSNMIAGLIIELDPSDHFPKASPAALIEGAGLLLHFVQNSTDSLREQLESGYGWPVSITSGDEFTVDEKGVYNYPDDPALHPYVKITLGNEHVYIYPYSLVTFFKDNVLLGYARMD